ncbi:MAG: LON peptidase substrate-binding domain-containing protein, partial [Chloroflexi bacterium]|nr:LON peptidase substrate-binding domain-containing protein [Chloroflexota bacterium]
MVEPQLGSITQPGVGTSELPIPELLPILPGESAVLFPFGVLPLSIKGEKWTRLINETVTGQRVLGYFVKREPEREGVLDNIYEVGVAASVARLLRLPDGTVQVLLQGLDRIRLLQLTETEPYRRGRVQVVPEDVTAGPELEALRRTVLDMFQRKYYESRPRGWLHRLRKTRRIRDALRYVW